MDKILRYDSVEVSYGEKAVVRDINFAVKAAEIMGIIGESGSGKSTILNAAMSILGQNGVVTKGDIWFEDKNLPDLNDTQLQKIKGSKIGMIFQDTGEYLCPVRTIGAHIYECMSAHNKISRQEAMQKALELFDRLSLKNGKRIFEAYPFELSGGMKQRVGIALAMLLNPKIILADEPTSALDVSAQKEVVKELMLLRELFGTTIILVTHNIGIVSALADQIIVLKDGNIVERGIAKDVLIAPQHEYTKKLLKAVPTLRRI